MFTNSLRDKLLQLIQSCDANTTSDFPALLELRELLKNGIKLECEDGGSENDQENDYLPTLIHHAAKTGSTELMKELAQTQPLNFKTRSGLTALHVAAAGLHLDLVQFLVDHIDCRSATTNLHPRQAERGWTALHYAAAATESVGSLVRQKAVILLLLHTAEHTGSQGGAQDIRHVRDSNGKLALHIFRLHHLTHAQDAVGGGEDAARAYVEMQRLLSSPMQGVVSTPVKPEELMTLTTPTDDEFAVCIETPIYVRECLVDRSKKGLQNQWPISEKSNVKKREYLPKCHSFHENGLCVADVMYGKGMDYMKSSWWREGRGLPSSIESWRGFRWLHLPVCNKVWLQNVIRAYFVQRWTELTRESGNIPRLREEHSQIQDELERSLSGSMRPKLVLPFSAMSDPPKKWNGMTIAVPYLTTCPSLYYKNTWEPLEESAKSKVNNPSIPEQMNNEVAMRLIHTYSSRQDVLYMPTLLERYGRDVSLSQEIKSRSSDQVFYQWQGGEKGAILDGDKLVCVVSQLWLCLIDDELDGTGTLVSLSPDRGPLSTTFNLGRELHHYSGVDSDLDPWISELDETAKIIPFIIALTARKSLGQTLQVQQGAAKYGLLEIYAMAVSNAASRERMLVDNFRKRVEEAKGEGDSLKIIIKEEMSLILDTKKIISELEIVKRLLADQLSLIIETSHTVKLDHEEQGHAIKMSMVGVNSRRVEDLLKNVEEITRNVYNLLDLKQRGANLAEAQWTRKQAEETARQGNIIMVFTIVTIIFLPMSFLSSFFALEIIEFPRDDENELRLGLSWTLMYIIAVTAAIAVPLVLIAFNINRVSGLWKHYIGHNNTHNEARPRAVYHAHQDIKVDSQDEEIDATSMQPTTSSPGDTTVLGKKKPMARGIGNLFRRRSRGQHADEVTV
ncbi:hypothetical protein MCOR25_000270 [Pyricularia grisea]|nr:hypothetical protein MCOR25_000270 [Pyricularia grisea]